MGFDPDTSSNDFLRGYVQTEPVADIPSRSPSDTLYQLEQFPSNEDRHHCQDTGKCVGSHSDSGVTENSGEEFASDHAGHDNGNIQKVEEVNEGKE